MTTMHSVADFDHDTINSNESVLESVPNLRNKGGNPPLPIPSIFFARQNHWGDTLAVHHSAICLDDMKVVPIGVIIHHTMSELTNARG